LGEVLWSAQSDEVLIGVVEGLQVLVAAAAAVEAGAVVEAEARDLAKDRLHFGSTGDWVTHVGGLRRGEGKRRVVRARGEKVMVESATCLDATDLARTGRHLVHVVDPEAEDRRLERALDREERAAHLGRFLAITDDGAGGVRLKGAGVWRTVRCSAQPSCR
jgi:hypothetical protein